IVRYSVFFVQDCLFSIQLRHSLLPIPCSEFNSPFLIPYSYFSIPNHPSLLGVPCSEFTSHNPLNLLHNSPYLLPLHPGNSIVLVDLTASNIYPRKSASTMAFERCTGCCRTYIVCIA